MQTNIYLVRHGEVHNPKKIVYGRLPGFGLSKKGVAEVKKSAEFLNNKNISAVYSSPLLRAKQTAQIIQNKLNLPEKIYLLKGLIEVKTSLDGKQIDKLDLVNLDYFAPPFWRKTDDTMESIADRMDKSLRTLLTRHKGKSIVAVSHGDPIMIIKSVINKLPLTIESIRPHNYLAHGEITQIQQIDHHPMTVKSVFIPKI